MIPLEPATGSAAVVVLFFGDQCRRSTAIESPCGCEPNHRAMNVVQEIKRINEQELQQGVSGKASWHHEYKDSAWVFAGGFPLDLTEGDILCVMSQWGEIEDINLCREKDTGKSKVRK